VFGLQAPLVVEAYDAAADPLASLEVDCTAQPEACMDISSSTNSYEGPGSNSAAEEAAAAYLHVASTGYLHATAGVVWDAVTGSQQVQQPTKKEPESVLDLTNKYEGSQITWQYRRQAEEAGAHYLPITALDLDCSPGADAAAQAECMLSRAVNKYEAGTPGTVAGGVDHDQLPVSDQGPDALPSASAGPAGVSTSSSHLTTLVAEQRAYFKNPCNSPASQVQYKNIQRQQQVHRRYYKNPANAPATLDTLLPTTVKVSTLPALWQSFALNLLNQAMCVLHSGHLLQRLLAACPVSLTAQTANVLSDI
jgi:hypothetical protein